LLAIRLQLPRAQYSWPKVRLLATQQSQAASQQLVTMQSPVKLHPLSTLQLATQSLPRMPLEVSLLSIYRLRALRVELPVQAPVQVVKRPQWGPMLPLRIQKRRILTRHLRHSLTARRFNLPLPP
jgi:hypothetical protein